MAVPQTGLARPVIRQRETLNATNRSRMSVFFSNARQAPRGNGAASNHFGSMTALRPERPPAPRLRLRVRPSRGVAGGVVELIERATEVHTDHVAQGWVCDSVADEHLVVGPRLLLGPQSTLVGVE